MIEAGEIRHSLCLIDARSKQAQSYAEWVVNMSGQSEGQNAEPAIRESRRRELRALVVSAAEAARTTRMKALSTTLNRATPQAIRDRISIFLAAVR
jgi:hypothetical protein